VEARGRAGDGDSAHPSPRDVTATYYIKTTADDVRDAMSKLESNIPVPKCLTDTFGTATERATPQSDAIQ